MKRILGAAAAMLLLAACATWTRVPGAAAYLVQMYGLSDVDRFYVVSGDKTSLKIGDAGAVASVLEPDSSYTWWVDAVVGERLDADAHTDGTGLGIFRFHLSGANPASYSTKPMEFDTAP